jgi:hypothetical protein
MVPDAKECCSIIYNELHEANDAGDSRKATDYQMIT